MNGYRESRSMDSGPTPPADPQVAARAGVAGGRSCGEASLGPGPVSRTTLRARLALIRPQALKAQSTRAGRS
jgi:hypothetical protein